MKATPTCVPCYLKQALSAAREVTDDPEEQRRVLNEVALLLPRLSLEDTPAHNSTYALWRAQEVLGCSDPFSSKKRDYNELALRLLPEIRSKVSASSEPLRTAVRVAAAGNVMDLGILSAGEVDVVGVLDQVVQQGFTVDDCTVLEERAATGTRLLYLLDNAGETVFDRVLIEELCARGAEVTAVVKGQAILNDATMEDAELAGLDSVCRVVSNGSPMIGTELGTCSEEFRGLFLGADLIVSKGQANFETLNETSRPIVFILKAKCPEVARELGVELGDVVAKFNPRFDRSPS
jgi:uncharacterized protein with ATP-grasp and redox domains